MADGEASDTENQQVFVVALVGEPSIHIADVFFDEGEANEDGKRRVRNRPCYNHHLSLERDLNE